MSRTEEKILKALQRAIAPASKQNVAEFLGYNPQTIGQALCKLRKQGCVVVDKRRGRQLFYTLSGGIRRGIS